MASCASEERWPAELGASMPAVLERLPQEIHDCRVRRTLILAECDSTESPPLRQPRQASSAVAGSVEEREARRAAHR